MHECAVLIYNLIIV